MNLCSPSAAGSAQVRPAIGSTHLAGTLTTESEELIRIDDTTVEIELPAELNARIGNSEALLDLARSDLDPDE